MPKQTFYVSGLDFDTIKANLKLYLKSQDLFSDYDFEGSGLSVLLDILSVNTHYLGYYLNMVANEMFCDSAAQRDSLVSIAKELNYTPRSRKSATAVVDLVLVPTSTVSLDPTITIPKFFKFSTTIDSLTYSFITDQAYTATLDEANKVYKVSNVTLKEGLGYSYIFSVDSDKLPYQKFEIPNANLDTSQLKVYVQASLSNTTTEIFSLASDVTVLDSTSAVYFLQEGNSGRYQIYFGDGILGKALDANNLVIADYIVCSAGNPNKAFTFVAAQQITGISSFQVTTVTPAYGGAERESMDSIRFTAPKHYESQSRAVTVDDYKTLIANKYPNAQSVSVWGGEDSNPPVFGKVFLSIKPVDGYEITDAVKKQIETTILSTNNLMTVIPEIVDPEYLFIELNSVVKYDAVKALFTEASLKEKVLTTISSYNLDNITSFERVFRYSVLTRLIDATDSAITNNWTTVKVQKRIVPVLKQYQNITVDFSSLNSIKPGTVGSSTFVVKDDPKYLQPYSNGDVFAFDDDGNGKLRVYKTVNSTKVIVNPNAGSVDYNNGKITITSFIPDSIVANVNYIKINATPVSNDIMPIRNYILTIDPLDTKVTMQVNTKVIA